MGPLVEKHVKPLVMLFCDSWPSLSFFSCSQEFENTLNAITGGECGYFLPIAAFSRRQLAGCTCPQTGSCPVTAKSDEDYRDPTNIFCQYDDLSGNTGLSTCF